MLTHCHDSLAMPHRQTLLDAHVHFYDVFDRTQFLDAALANFEAAARAHGLYPDLAGCLMFTETARDHYFRVFRDEADRGGNGTGGPWTFRHTAESDSVIARRNGRDALLIVAGRQLRTREGLELLALARDAEYPDGLPLAQAIELVHRGSAIVTLPWGFGKWWFGRGRLMAEEVGKRTPGSIFLGDNSGRPGVLPTPALFRAAHARHIFVLPGTDPLPFESEALRPGSFGFILDDDIDPERPAEAIRARLRALTRQPQTYGRLESPGRFLRNQVKIVLRKRL